MSDKERIKFKTVVIMHSATSRGGAEQVMLETVEHLTQLGVESHFVLPAEGSLAELLRAKKIPFTIIEYGWWTDGLQLNNLPITSPTNLQAVHKLTSLYRNLQPDICLTNTSVTPWGAIAASLCSIPHVWLIHELLYKGSELNLGLDRPAILQDINQLSDLVITNSKATSAYVLDFVDKTKVFQMYPLLHSSKIERLAAASINLKYHDDKALKLVIVGRVVPEKGQLDAIKAVKALTDEGLAAELMVIGEVSPIYRKKLETQLKKWHLQKEVHIVGHQDNPYPYIKQADVAICASAIESFGRATAEAMILGKPVVGTAAGGTAELIEPGKTGFLYKAGDVSELTRCIKTIAQSCDMQRLGKAARVSILEKIDAGNKAKELHQRLITITHTPFIPKMPLAANLLLGIASEASPLLSASATLSLRKKATRSLHQTYHNGKRYLHTTTTRYRRPHGN